MKIAIVASEFNKEITDQLIFGAIEEFKNNGFDSSESFDFFYVPGAFEIPSIVKNILEKKQSDYDSIITFGSIIKGDTAHFEFISSSVFNSLSSLSIDTNTKIPILLGILTTYDYSQAVERSDPNKKNKGAEVMKAALQSIEIFRKI